MFKTIRIVIVLLPSYIFNALVICSSKFGPIPALNDISKFMPSLPSEVDISIENFVHIYSAYHTDPTKNSLDELYASVINLNAKLGYPPEPGASWLDIRATSTSVSTYAKDLLQESSRILQYERLPLVSKVLSIFGDIITAKDANIKRNPQDNIDLIPGIEAFQARTIYGINAIKKALERLGIIPPEEPTYPNTSNEDCQLFVTEDDLECLPPRKFEPLKSIQMAQDIHSAFSEALKTNQTGNFYNVLHKYGFDSIAFKERVNMNDYLECIWEILYPIANDRHFAEFTAGLFEEQYFAFFKNKLEEKELKLTVSEADLRKVFNSYFAHIPVLKTREDAAKHAFKQIFAFVFNFGRNVDDLLTNEAYKLMYDIMFLADLEDLALLTAKTIHFDGKMFVIINGLIPRKLIDKGSYWLIQTYDVKELARQVVASLNFSNSYDIRKAALFKVAKMTNHGIIGKWWKVWLGKRHSYFYFVECDIDRWKEISAITGDDYSSLYQRLYRNLMPLVAELIDWSHLPAPEKDQPSPIPWKILSEAYKIAEMKKSGKIDASEFPEISYERLEKHHFIFPDNFLANRQIMLDKFIIPSVGFDVLRSWASSISKKTSDFDFKGILCPEFGKLIGKLKDFTDDSKKILKSLTNLFVVDFTDFVMSCQEKSVVYKTWADIIEMSAAFLKTGKHETIDFRTGLLEKVDGEYFQLIAQVNNLVTKMLLEPSQLFDDTEKHLKTVGTMTKSMNIVRLALIILETRDKIINRRHCKKVSLKLKLMIKHVKSIISRALSNPEIYHFSCSLKFREAILTADTGYGHHSRYISRPIKQAWKEALPLSELAHELAIKVPLDLQPHVYSYFSKIWDAIKFGRIYLKLPSSLIDLHRKATAAFLMFIRRTYDKNIKKEDPLYDEIMSALSIVANSCVQILVVAPSLMDKSLIKGTYDKHRRRKFGKSELKMIKKSTLEHFENIRILSESEIYSNW